MVKNDLKDLGLPKAHICIPSEKDAKNSYILKEKDPGAKLQTVSVEEIPNNTLIWQIENIALNGFLNPGAAKKWAYNKHGDYVMLTDNDCVFIELKSNPKLLNIEEDCRKKFHADTCLIMYADLIIERLCKDNPIFKGLNFHYVLLHGSEKLHKPLLGPPQKSSNDSPDKFRSIRVHDAGRISFKDFL